MDSINLKAGHPERQVPCSSWQMGGLMQCVYRPFTKQWQFFSRRLNEMVYQMPRIFPDSESPNRVIAVSGKGARNQGSTALMMDALPKP